MFAKGRDVTAPIEFWFDFSSPYGYLAAQRIEALAARHGRSVDWRPILLGPIFKVVGTGPLTQIPLKDWDKQGAKRTGAFGVLVEGERVVAQHRLLRERFKCLKLPRPDIDVVVENGVARFRSSGFVWGVCLDLDGEAHRYFTAATRYDFEYGGATEQALRLGKLLAAEPA